MGQLDEILFSIPWGHHRFLMDRYSKEPAKAFYYVRKTMEEGWSRDVMLNHKDSSLYEREGKALTNFKTTLPEVTSELVQEKVIRIVETSAWGAPLKVELRTEI